jgi:hypothetical protein
MGCGCNYSGGAYSNATGKTEGMGNIDRGRAGIPWEIGLGDTTFPKSGGRAPGSVEISAPNPPSNMVVTSSRQSSNPFRPTWVGYYQPTTTGNPVRGEKMMKSFDGGVLASQIEGYSNAAGGPTRYLPPAGVRNAAGPHMDFPSSQRPADTGYGGSAQRPPVTDIWRKGQPYNPNPPITPTSGRSASPYWKPTISIDSRTAGPNDGGKLASQILGRGNREDFIG